VTNTKKLTNQQIDDLRFAWRVVKHGSSNAVVLVKKTALVGFGWGSTNRLSPTKAALEMARLRSQGAVAASDGFFPFDDGPKYLCRYGITAIIQPAGAKRQQEVIDICDQHGVVLALTDHRAFRH
jgi:phosphoribosylaminoimidazolecarboxamide formyltransferase / IMP cyclohydrolase